MLKRTPFYESHKNAGAKLIDFGGFEMPVHYEGIKIEHHAVRQAAGLFDVSHMGEVIVEGPSALEFLQHITINDVSKLQIGKAQYSAMCYPHGGIVDDLIIYMLDDQRYLLVINASNREKDVQWMKDHLIEGVRLSDESDDYCLLALQGSSSQAILSTLTTADIGSIPYYHFTESSVANFSNVIISATGYTGEPGFEIYFKPGKQDPNTMWDAMMTAGEPFGIKACGLGARDTLRLEMGYALYGNDISDKRTPIEAGLGWITKLNKGSFIASDVLASLKELGTQQKLIGFVMDDEKAIPRSHFEVKNDQGKTIGEVTSGTQSVTLGIGIGMAYLDSEYATPNQKIYIDIRGKRAPATTQKPPFVHKK
jgi:aminomethyltransferase